MENPRRTFLSTLNPRVGALIAGGDVAATGWCRSYSPRAQAPKKA